MPSEDALHGVGRRSVLALAAAAVSGVATIATLIIANRALDQTAAGEYFVAISLFTIVQGLCSFGIETGLQYFVPTMRPHDAHRLIRVVQLISFGAGVVIAIGVWVFANPFGSLLAEGGVATDGTIRVIRSIAVLLPVAGVYEVAMGALRSTDQVLVSTVLDRIIRPVAQVVAMLVAAVASDSALAVVIAWAAPNVAAVVAAVVLLARLPIRTSNVDPEDVSARTFWSYTAPRGLARIAQTLTQRVDVLIIAAVASLDDAAVYGTVSRSMIAGVFIATALRQTVQPQLRRLVVRGDAAAVKSMYGATTTWLVLATWPVYLAMITFAPLVMRVFGEDYERGAPALVLLCLAMLVATACGLVDVVLLMIGRSWLSTVNVLVALALNIGLNLILIPHYGMIGAAVAWVVAILCTNLLPLLQTSRVGLHPGGVPLSTAVTVSILGIAVPLGIGRIVGDTTWTSFAVSLLLAGVLFSLLVAASSRRLLLDRLVSDLRRRNREVVRA